MIKIRVSIFFFGLLFGGQVFAVHFRIPIKIEHMINSLFSSFQVTGYSLFENLHQIYHPLPPSPLLIENDSYTTSVLAFGEMDPRNRRIVFWLNGIVRVRSARYMAPDYEVPVLLRLDMTLEEPQQGVAARAYLEAPIGSSVTVTNMQVRAVHPIVEISVMNSLFDPLNGTTPTVNLRMEARNDGVQLPLPDLCINLNVSSSQ